jgi:hypothetical protein
MEIDCPGRTTSPAPVDNASDCVSVAESPASKVTVGFDPKFPVTDTFFVASPDVDSGVHPAEFPGDAQPTSASADAAVIRTESAIFTGIHFSQTTLHSVVSMNSSRARFLNAR